MLLVQVNQLMRKQNTRSLPSGKHFIYKGNYSILFYETFAYGNNWWGWNLFSLKMKLNADFLFLIFLCSEKWKLNINLIFIFQFLKKWKLNTDFPFFIFQLSEKMNDPNIHAFVTSVRVAIFRCGIKGQGFKVCEFAILIIMFGGFSVLSNFYCAFSVFTYILSGFSVSNRPQCPPPPSPSFPLRM